MTGVLLNGTPTGFSHVGFAAFSPTFTINSGLVSGTNTLEFQSMNEGAGPGGFRALLSGSALVILTNTPLPAGSFTRYFRQAFDFTGNPALTELKLNAIVDDGAVFYLNGEEIYRYNMPDTLINHSTPASSVVSSPSYTGFVTIPSEFLVEGPNVLAVEVHQATGGGGSMLFGAELAAKPLLARPLELAFNEFSASTNAEFFVELHNYGTDPLDLTGYRIVRDGVTNQEHVLAGPALFSGGDFLPLTETMLGFKPEDGDKLLLVNPAGEKVLDGAVLTRGPRARYPDGNGPWLRPTLATPGAANNVALQEAIVINEIMYHHRAGNSVDGSLPVESEEAWLELYNRGAQTVDLTGWQLTDGIDYDFTTGTMMAPGEYLVVAKDAAALRLRYPGIRIVGNFGGRLSHKSDRIVLEDASGNPADEVHYADGGRWPE
ncbi:MAG TPA: lamin tail domain-containing protein, partial [Verrucomicrobiae bacterium]|nr:lamin tail domain-containing protein [Verrucomicrobiae bacterium]